MRKKYVHDARWRNMMRRCYDSTSHAYKWYGARGIEVCEEWKDRLRFIAWCERTFEDGKSLDRVDVDRGYSPDNCRWATQSEQVTGRRKTPAVERKLKNLSLFSQQSSHNKYGDPRSRSQKICVCCKNLLVLNEFSKNKANVDGHHSKCRKCCKAAYDPEVQRLYYERRKACPSQSKKSQNQA